MPDDVLAPTVDDVFGPDPDPAGPLPVRASARGPESLPLLRPADLSEHRTWCACQRCLVAKATNLRRGK